MSKPRTKLAPPALIYSICMADPHVPALAAAMREAIDYEFNRVAGHIGAGDARAAYSGAKTLVIYARRVMQLEDAMRQGGSLLDVMQAVELETYFNYR